MLLNKKVNGVHSENGVKLHKEQCGGKLAMEECAKPNLGAVFELWRCTTPGCNYAGRGKKIRDMEVVDSDGEVEILFSGSEDESEE